MNRQEILKNGITFEEFKGLAADKQWTLEDLVGMFKDRVDEPTRLFQRILDPKYGDVVIPYRSLLEAYMEEMRFRQAENAKTTCRCGCGALVNGRRQYAFAACRKRAQRQAVRDRAEIAEMGYLIHEK